MPGFHHQGMTRFCEGPENAQVMLIGQNPGREEVKQKRPFVGRAGQYLNKVFKKKGLKREKMFLTGVVHEPTPGNRMPNSKEIERWMPFLLVEIERIHPRIIVLMGRVAWETPRFEGIEYIETYHPAAAMRFPKIRKRFEKDMGRLKQRLSQI